VAACALTLAICASPAAASEQGPDLTIAKLAVTGSPAPGQSLTAALTVRNAGRRRAQASATAVVLSRDARRSSDDGRLGGGRAKALAPRRTGKATLRLAVPAGTAAGAYRLIACADAAKRVKESDERNNCRSAAVTVAPAAFGGPGANPATGSPGGSAAAEPPGGQPSPTPAPGATPSPTVTPSPTPSATPTPGPSPAPDPFPKPPLPPAGDPADAAPGLGGTAATNVAGGARFLYTGADPIQKDVDAGTIEPERIAVLRGRVLKPGPDPAGPPVPMSGARVTVLDHPELGYTSTRADGGYDLAVNGGGELVLHVEQEGFASVQRTEDVPWQDYVAIEDVVMTPYSPKVMQVDENATTLQAVTSDQVSDADGPRRATLMFEPGTDATMTLPDGTQQPLGDLAVRATEYTVGARGDEAMPGDLPASSAYTYAVEFSVDQAVAAGATDVRFTKPVATYVENFLGFAAGTAVPAAYYDEGEGRWVPSENGVVIQRAEGGVDVTGDGHADDPAGAAMAKWGLDAAEVAKLLAQYPDGKSLWRVAVRHFTPWDYNWPYGCKADCDPPRLDPPPAAFCPECQAAGSIVGVFNQTLGERVPLAGSPFSLHYESGRMPGYGQAYRLKIPLTGPAIRPLLRSVELEVTVAGRTLERSFTSPTPNMSFDYEWDGKDAYGRPVSGAQTARVRVGYAYPVEYLQPDEFAAAFAQFGGAPLSRPNPGGTGEARREVVAWQEWTRPIGVLGTGSDALGGWTLDIHHSYDPQSHTLHMGDGTTVTGEAIRSEIRTVLGRAQTVSWDGDTPATRVTLGLVRGADAGADGSVYAADARDGRVYRAKPGGALQLIAGGTEGGDGIGDGGPALQATLLSPADVAAAPDGSLYVSDTGNGRVRRVDPGGTIRTVAGGGDPGALGDGGPATAASLLRPRGLALAADGTLYVAEAGRDRVRRIAPDGRISTAAGGGAALGDGGPAADAALSDPTDVAVDADGALYIADAGHHRVRKVTAAGLIDTVAGNGEPGSSGDGGSATAAEIGQPYGIDVGRDGTLYIADRIHHVVRRVDGGGAIGTFAGSGHGGAGGDGSAPRRADLSFPEDVTVAPDGSVLIADSGNGRVRRAAVGLPGYGDAEFSVPSEDGTEVYQFDRDGRHLRTVEALTGVVRWSFGYDAGGRLVSVTDGDGNRTGIVRDGAGAATAIEAPGGIRTALSLRGDGQLGAVTNPEGEAVTLDYLAGGLLRTLTDARAKTASFTYEPGTGRLLTDTDKNGATVTLRREAAPGGFQVVRTSEEGKETRFRAEYLPGGGVRSRITDPSGAESVTTRGEDGVTTITDPDGTVTTTRLAGDPRWGMRAPIAAEVTRTTPGGRRNVITHARSVALDPAHAGDPFAVATLTDTVSVNGHASTRTYSGATRTLRSVSAKGRVLTTTFDAHGRPVAEDFGPDTADVVSTWDAKGRLTKVTQGPSQVTYGYDPARPQRLVSRTDGLGRTTSFGYDAAERVTSVTLPGGGTYGFEYDKAGDRTAIVMPGGARHAFAFSGIGQATGYTPPGGPQWTRAFDGDRSPTGSTLPGRGATTLARKPDGRLTGATAADGTASTFAYPAGDGTARFTQATRTLPGGRVDATTIDYDGALVTRRESRDAGGTYATHTFAYGDDLRPSSTTVAAGGETVTTALTRDDDGLLTGYGPFTITRNGPVGAPSRIADAALDLALGYDAVGRESTRTLKVAGAQAYALALTRDAAGRITRRVETVGGATSTYDYAYTADGQLETVKDGATTLEAYAYDADGNRRVAGTTTTYDAGDVLQSRDGTAYAFDQAGFLTGRAGATFAYSDSGELLQATAGGTTVSYAYDSAGRRTARIQDGRRTQYLYGDPARPLLVTGSREPGGQLTTYYYDPDGRLFALRRGGATYYVGTDQVGTPKVVVDAAGTVVKTLVYDAFGRRNPAGATETGAGFELPIGFAGGLEDPVTGLVRFGLRDYEPASGRWTTRDPILQAGGLNVFAYAGSDPVGGRDLSGLADVRGFFSGLADKVAAFFTDDTTKQAVEFVSEIDSEGPIVKGAGKLKYGLDKLETIQEVADSALEVKEALDEPTDPEQAAGLLKCGLKWIKKVLPVDLVGTDVAAEVLDRGMEHAKDQRDYGSINAGVQRQMREIEF
jgi:RHS repeat-associated protein